MAGLLNSWSIVMCPHGRTVQSTTSNTRVKAVGDFSFPYGGHIPDQRFPVHAWSGASFVRASAMGSTRRPKQGCGPFHVDGSRRGSMRTSRPSAAGNSHGLFHPAACFRPIKRI